MLNELLAGGLISDDQYATAFAKDFKGLEGAQKESDTFSALLQGSTEAHSADVNFQRQQD